MTNATDVKPMLTVATYLDSISGLEVYQEVTGALLSTFIPAALPACPLGSPIALCCCWQGRLGPIRLA